MLTNTFKQKVKVLIAFKCCRATHYYFNIVFSCHFIELFYMLLKVFLL